MTPDLFSSRLTIFHQLVLLNFLIINLFIHAASADSHPKTLALKHLSLEEFADLDLIVTSATKKPEKISKSSTAIFVITQEDIQRSGVSTVPEALRMAPGIHVARIDANKWSISARGFSGRFANKLLVMKDGRTLYNPFFSGVYWDVQNAQIENIERIEIITGPAAALWGANAVNGVINIISQSAISTTGSKVSSEIGSRIKKGFLRHGGQFSDDLYYRLSVDYLNHDDSVTPLGADSSDHWDHGETGFKLDWHYSEQTQIDIQGDYFRGESNHTSRIRPSLIAPFQIEEDVNVKKEGANVITQIKHQFSDQNNLQFKFYFDYISRDSKTINQQFHTYDWELNHYIQLSDVYSLNWGGGYRMIDDQIKGLADISINQASKTTHFYNAFIHNEFTLLPEQLKTVLALRIDHNHYSGFEFQPTARINWSPDTNHNLWAAVSRAVKTPSRAIDSRIEQTTIPVNPPQLVALIGNPDVDSEEVIAYELGYKFNLGNRFHFNLSGYYNVYDELRSFEPGAPVLQTATDTIHVLVPFGNDNKLEGESVGFELSAHWHVNTYLSLKSAYSYNKISLHKKDNSQATGSENDEGTTPQQQFSLRSELNFNPEWSADLWFRFVDRLPTQSINAYATFNAKLTWEPVPGLELSLIGKNLASAKQLEYNPEIVNITPSKTKRSILGRIVWQF